MNRVPPYYSVIHRLEHNGLILDFEGVYYPPDPEEPIWSGGPCVDIQRAILRHEAMPPLDILPFLELHAEDWLDSIYGAMIKAEEN